MQINITLQAAKIMLTGGYQVREILMIIVYFRIRLAADVWIGLKMRASATLLYHQWD